MATRPRRKTFHHGDLKQAALAAAYDLVGRAGHEALTLREVAAAVGVTHRSLYNHFADRNALLDAVATEAFLRMAASLKTARNATDFTRDYVRFALANPAIYALTASRPHGTMKHHPPLQSAAHAVITEAMRIFCDPNQTSAMRRRTVMKVHMIHHGGISLYVAGILDLASEHALVGELSAMIAQS
jgi:AcrR family transcriptional regulator